MSSLSIRSKNNGPLFIAPEDAETLVLTDQNGAPIRLSEGENIALCRRGASKRKPFCDAGHHFIGFDGTLAPEVLAPASKAPSGVAEPTLGGDAPPP